VTAPGADDLFQVLDETWPAAAFREVGPWVLREGAGGGQRVSAATARGPVDRDAVGRAEGEMREMGQRPLFMIRGEDQTLDTLLEARGYEVVDPVVIYLSPLSELVAELPYTAAMPSWPPLAIQCEIWAAGGIGPARVDVMGRAAGKKAAMLGRSGDRPSGTGFVALSGDVAMLHALEVVPDARRKGVGRAILQGCANWAHARGAAWMALAVTRANVAANALYQALGMREVAKYHYRRAPEGGA